MYDERLIELVEKCKLIKRTHNYSPKRGNSLGLLLYKETNFLPDRCGIRERLYHIENNLINPVKCYNCNNLPTWDWRNLKYKKYCPKCSLISIESVNKGKQTKLKKYGHENYCNSAKIKQTKLKKYGDPFFTNREKCKQTNLKNHGVKYSWQRDDVKKNIKRTTLERHGDENYRNPQKTKQTCIKKYGVEHTFQVQKFRDLGKKTKLEKYGNENYNNLEKYRETCLKKYGVDNPNQSKEIKKKIKQTTSKNYHKKFLEISNKIHNRKYEYAELKNSHEKIEIICPEHGSFYQKMYVHMRGNGCPKCSKQGFSEKAIEWLNHISEKENIYIQHALNKGEYQIPGSSYKVDGYCEKTNTCYEFLGDFWHGNPKIYDKKQIVHPNGKSVEECYNNTINRLVEIKNLGYNIEYIWENDWNGT